MAKATFDIKTIQTLQTEAQKQARKALNAGVGVTDLAVEVVRDVRKSVVDFEPRAFGTQAVKTVNRQVLAVPARVQQVVDINVNAATDAYGDLVKRGETLVRRIRRQKSTQDTVAAAETTVAKAKTTRTQVTTAAKKSAAAAKTAAKKASAPKRTAAKSSAKATRTSAKKTVSAGSRALTDAAKKIGD
ncbi:MAG: hypothetical protein ABIO16_12690 [Nocardioides sp.]